MGMLMYLSVVACVLAAVVIYYPIPPLTPNLIKWKNKGAYFKFKTHDIFYIVEEGGDQNGDVLVTFHGFPTSSYDWIKVLDGIKSHHSKVILFDLLGFGLSDKPQGHNYSLMEQADIAEALLRMLNIKNFHILSHDYGDTVALELLARFNKKESNIEILSLCLSNGGIFPETNKPRPLQKLLVIPYLGAILTRLSFFSIFKRGFGDVFGTKTQPSESEFLDFYSAISNNHGYRNNHRLLQYLNERSQYKHRWVGALKDTLIPVHMIYGPADPVNPSPFSDHYWKTVPRHSIEVLHSDIGHYPQWEAPKEFIASYRKFKKTH